MKKLEKFDSCILRIYDEKMRNKLSELYAGRKEVFGWSKNTFLTNLIAQGLKQEEKNIRNEWELKNEQRTIMDAIKEHTKRMNYSIKFNKPFIKNTYANEEIILIMLTRMYNFMKWKMSAEDKKDFENYLNMHFNKLPNELKESKQKMFEYYDYEVEIADKKEKTKEESKQIEDSEKIAKTSKEKSNIFEENS